MNVSKREIAGEHHLLQIAIAAGSAVEHRGARFSRCAMLSVEGTLERDSGTQGANRQEICTGPRAVWPPRGGNV
jgi:hypothetical protein